MFCRLSDSIHLIRPRGMNFWQRNRKLRCSAVSPMRVQYTLACRDFLLGWLIMSLRVLDLILILLEPESAVARAVAGHV